MAIAYHATFACYLPSIMELGLGAIIPRRNYEDSEPGKVYLAYDPYEAESYAECAEWEGTEEPPEEIVILAVDVNKLDQARFSSDPNVLEDDSTFCYEGIIDAAYLKVFDPKKEVHIDEGTD